MFQWSYLEWFLEIAWLIHVTPWSLEMPIYVYKWMSSVTLKNQWVLLAKICRPSLIMVMCTWYSIWLKNLEWDENPPKQTKTKSKPILQYLSIQAIILSTSVSYGDLEAMLRADFFLIWNLFVHVEKLCTGKLFDVLVNI